VGTRAGRASWVSVEEARRVRWDFVGKGLWRA